MSEQNEKTLTPEEELAAAQARLAEAQARLAAAEEVLAENGLELDEHAEAGEGEAPAKPAKRRKREEFYDKFEGVPIKYIDWFIGLCCAAFFVVVVLGALHGRGIF